MMDPTLRATMTKAETQREKDGTGNVHLPFQFTNEITDLATTPIYDPKFASKQHVPEDRVVNFGGGTSAWALKKIVREDLIAAREKIKQKYEAGLSMKQKLEKAKKIMAGILTGKGSHHVGLDV